MRNRPPKHTTKQNPEANFPSRTPHFETPPIYIIYIRLYIYMYIYIYLNDHSYTKFNNLGLSYYKFTSRSEIHNSTRFLSLVCFCGNVKKFSSCWGLSSCIQGSCFTILEMMMLMVSSDRSSGFCRCFNSIGRLIRQ